MIRLMRRWTGLSRGSTRRRSRGSLDGAAAAAAAATHGGIERLGNDGDGTLGRVGLPRRTGRLADMAGRGRAGADGVLESSSRQPSDCGGSSVAMEGMMAVLLGVLVGTLADLVGRNPARLQLQDGLLGDAVHRTVPSGLGINGGILDVLVININLEGIHRSTGQRGVGGNDQRIGIKRRTVDTRGRLGRWGVEVHLHLHLHLGGGHRRCDGSKAGGSGVEAPSPAAAPFDLLGQQPGISSNEDGMATTASTPGLATPHGGKAVLEHVGNKRPTDRFLQLHHLGPAGIQPPTAQPVQPMEILQSNLRRNGGSNTQQVQTKEDGDEGQFRRSAGGTDGGWETYGEFGQVARQLVQHVQDQGAVPEGGWVRAAGGGGAADQATGGTGIGSHAAGTVVVVVVVVVGPAKQGHHPEQVTHEDHGSRRVDPPPQHVEHVPLHVDNVVGGELPPGQLDEAGQAQLGPVDPGGSIRRGGDGRGPAVLDEILVDR